MLDCNTELAPQYSVRYRHLLGTPILSEQKRKKSFAALLPEVPDVSVDSGREEGRNDDESGMIGKRQRLRRLKLRLFISQRREGVVIIIWKGRAGPGFFARILGPRFAC